MNHNIPFPQSYHVFSGNIYKGMEWYIKLHIILNNFNSKFHKWLAKILASRKLWTKTLRKISFLPSLTIEAWWGGAPWIIPKLSSILSTWINKQVYLMKKNTISTRYSKKRIQLKDRKWNLSSLCLIYNRKSNKNSLSKVKSLILHLILRLQRFHLWPWQQLLMQFEQKS